MSPPTDRGIRRDPARWEGWGADSWGERLRRIWEVLVQSVKDLVTDSGPQWAAAVAYYSLLSAFPLLLAAVSLAAYFVDPNQAIDQATRLLGEFLPEGEEQIATIVREAVEASGQASLLSLAALLWTGSRVFGVLTRALNVAFDVDEHYSFFKRLLVEAVMMLTIGVIFVLALASGLLVDLLWRVLQVLPAGRGLAFELVQEAIRVALLLASFFLIYRFVPRGRRDSRAALVGAVVATLLFLAARPLFVGYVQQFGRHSVIYGPLAIAIILVLWAWLVALITLFGGELAGHVRTMLIEGQTPEEVERAHQERAPVRPARPDERGERAQ